MTKIKLAFFGIKIIKQKKKKINREIDARNCLLKIKLIKQKLKWEFKKIRNTRGRSVMLTYVDPQASL